MVSFVVFMEEFYIWPNCYLVIFFSDSDSDSDEDKKDPDGGHHESSSASSKSPIKKHHRKHGGGNKKQRRKHRHRTTNNSDVDHDNDGDRKSIIQNGSSCSFLGLITFFTDKKKKS